MAVEKLYGKDLFRTNSDLSYISIRTDNNFKTMHTHDFYEITVITKGSLKHIVNEKEQTIHENTIIYMRPDDIHYIVGLENKDFEYLNIAFPKETMQDLFMFLCNDKSYEQFHSAKYPPTVHLTADEISQIKNHIQELSLISATKNSRKEKTYFKFLISHLLFIYYQNANDDKKYHPAWFGELLNQITQLENLSLGVEHLSELSGKSLAHISRVFKENLNTTPTDYLNEIRLKYCANKLIHSDDDIIDIAMEVGFNNLSHFYHLFKKKYNTTPKKYRKARLNII